MKYRIGICDDELSTCSELENYIIELFRELPDIVEVFVWNSAEAFIADVPDKVNVDILFLDIELPNKNGVDVGYYIRETMYDAKMEIIYISSKTSYAMKLFNIHPYNFLVKPINKQKINEEIKALLQLNNSDRRFFAYTYNKNQFKILIGDIIYFKCEKHHIKVICKDDTKEYVGKIKKEAEKLPDNFVMINQSNIVNLRHIQECAASDIVMDNGDILTISRNYRKTFNEKMIENSKWKEIKNGFI